MTLYWCSISGAIRGHTDTPLTLDNWYYDIFRRYGVYVAEVCTKNGNWDVLGTFDNVEEAKKFVELFELTGART